MKKGMTILFLSVVLAIVMSLSVLAEFPEIEVSTDSIADKALINWKTDMAVTTSIEINGKIYVFGPAKSFSHEETGLEEGQSYKYRIVACSDSYCTTHKSAVKTAGQSAAASPLTGNVIASIGNARAEIYYFLIALIGLTLIFITYRSNQPSVKIKSLLENSENHIKKGAHHKAIPTYKQALGVYKNLSTEEKAMNYHRLMRVYSHLSLNEKQKEAKALTERYQKGTITQQELMRLRQLLTE